MRFGRAAIVVAGLVVLAACSSTPDASGGDDAAERAAPDGGATGAAGTDGDSGPQDGGDAAPATDLMDLDVCTLLSTAEVASIAGNAVEDGQSMPFLCSWNAAELEDVIVTIGLLPSFGGEDPCAAMGGNGSVETQGVGDRAFWRFEESSSFNVGSLEVCTADLGVDVELAGLRDEPTLRSAAEQLAVLVLDRV